MLTYQYFHKHTHTLCLYVCTATACLHAVFWFFSSGKHKVRQSFAAELLSYTFNILNLHIIRASWQRLIKVMQIQMCIHELFLPIYILKKTIIWIVIILANSLFLLFVLCCCALWMHHPVRGCQQAQQTGRKGLFYYRAVLRHPGDRGRV